MSNFDKAERTSSSSAPSREGGRIDGSRGAPSTNAQSQKSHLVRGFIRAPLGQENDSANSLAFDRDPVTRNRGRVRRPRLNRLRYRASNSGRHSSCNVKRALSEHAHRGKVGGIEGLIEKLTLANDAKNSSSSSTEEKPCSLKLSR